MGLAVIGGVIWLILALTTGRKAADRGMSQWGGIVLGLIIGALALPSSC